MEKQMPENILEQLRKELRITRVVGIVSSVLTGALLFGGIVLYGQMRPVLELAKETGSIIEELAELDIESVNMTLEQVGNTLGSVDWKEVSNAIESVDWQQVSDTIGELDVEAFNNAVEDLDTKEFSKAIERLNKVIDVLEGWGEKLGSIKGIF